MQVQVRVARERRGDDTAKGSLNQSWSKWSCGDESRHRWITVEKLELIHAKRAPTSEGVHLSDVLRRSRESGQRVLTLDNCEKIAAFNAAATDCSNVCPINFRRYGPGLPRCSRVTGNQGSIPERAEKRLPLPGRQQAQNPTSQKSASER